MQKNILKLIPNQIGVNRVTNDERVKFLTGNFLNIDTGEAEVLVLAEEQKCTAITDDLKSLSELRQNSKTKVYLSAYIFAMLVLNGMYTKDYILDRIDALADVRDWKSSALYIYSKRYIENLAP